jgi:C4-dicarboxylate-specific signal transduction histidine kinase
MSLHLGKKLPKRVAFIILWTVLAQTIPFFFVLLDAHELQIELSPNAFLEIYNSQRLYLFSSLFFSVMFNVLFLFIKKNIRQRHFFSEILNELEEIVVVFNDKDVPIFKNDRCTTEILQKITDKESKLSHKKIKEEWSFESQGFVSHFLVSYHPFSNRQASILILTDITELKQKHHHIQEQDKRLAQSVQMASLGEMAAGIAHEINNPLAVILGNSTLLKIKTTQKAPELLGLIEKIEGMANRISELVKSMKKLTRKDQNQSEFKIVNFRELMQDVLNITEIKKKQIGVDVATNIDNIPDLEITGNYIQISQVLINIIINAFQAIANLEERWVKIELFETLRHEVKIEIANSGPLIPEETYLKMFTPFFTTKPPGEGSGLGLSLCKNIIESHKGQIYIDRTRAHTTFIIVIPVNALEKDLKQEKKVS